MSSRQRQHQRGVALIIVLLIVALVVVLGTEMGGRLQLNIQRIQNIKDNNQAQWYAYSAEAFAEKSIKLIYEQSAEKIHAGQPWAEEVIFPLDGGGLQAQLVDMQSCFNLNALAVATSDQLQEQSVTPQMEAFQRLLASIEREEPLESFTIDTVRDSLADWLDTDDRTRDFGAEDPEYESRPVPYLAANGLMVSQTEFRLINGVSSEWINEVWPFVCVIPNSSLLKINVNTITSEQAPVLAGLAGISLSEANELIGRRPGDGWEDIEDFLGESVFQTTPLTDEQRAWFDITTTYFILHTKARYNNASFSMSSLFQSTSATSVSVIRREFGGIE